MSLDTLAQLGEFIGGVFVVVSLAYLAHQIRQNTRSLRTENYGRVLDRMSALQSRLSSDAGLNRVFMVGAQDPSRLTRSERTQFAWALYELFGAGEFMYHQSLEKALPPAVWERWRATIAWWLTWPGIRAWWAAKPSPLAADFQAFGDEMLRAHRQDPEAIARWEAFVAGGDPVPPDGRRLRSDRLVAAGPGARSPLSDPASRTRTG